ncbi:MAG: hypothetical protein AB8B64_25305 [Granulosicoccus sp.]
MQQTPINPKRQYRLDLESEPQHELTQEVLEPMIEALASLLLEAYGQEQIDEIEAQGKVDE